MTDIELAIKKLEDEKLVLIKKYMELQDVVDDYNEKIYDVCCKIEALNKKIEQEKIKLAARNS